MLIGIPRSSSLVSADASFAVNYFASSKTGKPDLLRMLAFYPVNAIRRNVVAIAVALMIHGD